MILPSVASFVTMDLLENLKQLLEDMEKDLGDITKTEDAAIADFESLVAAKEKEIAAATEAIEMKLEKNGEMAVKIVNLKNDLEDAQESLGEDQKFLAELKKGCATAGADYDARVKARAEELVAVQETIKILNDDDALDLFKKTLPSPSLLQMRTERDIRDDALSAMQDAAKRNPQQLGFIELALQGKKVSFDKVIKMIDDMVVLLGEEQKDDDAQKEWCETEFRTSELKEGDHRGDGGQHRDVEGRDQGVGGGHRCARQVGRGGYGDAQGRARGVRDGDGAEQRGCAVAWRRREPPEQVLQPGGIQAAAAP